MRSPAASMRPCRSATSGPSGCAPALMASPTCFEAALRSALRRLALAEQPPALGVELERRVHQRRILALGDGALADRVRLVAQSLHADAHRRGLPRQAADDERRIEAGQQPAGPRPVGAAEERSIERSERVPRRCRTPSRSRR